MICPAKFTREPSALKRGGASRAKGVSVHQTVSKPPRGWSSRRTRPIFVLACHHSDAETILQEENSELMQPNESVVGDARRHDVRFYLASTFDERLSLPPFPRPDDHPMCILIRESVLDTTKPRCLLPEKIQPLICAASDEPGIEATDKLLNWAALCAFP